MNQREITEPTPLLDAKGRLAYPGYARRMLFRYDPRAVKAGPLARKEWDFYQIALDGSILQMTIGHVSYMASFSAALFSPATGERRSFTRMRPLPLGSLRMPVDPDAPYEKQYGGKGWEMEFDIRPRRRRLRLQANEQGGVDVDILLGREPDDDKMVVATPFEKPGLFYLNCKENYYAVEGYARFGDAVARPRGDDTALMDWGRGAWPFHHEWFWGNGAARLEDGRFAFNIGWGFGDLSRATENMFFWNGKAYKLGSLNVERDASDYMNPWRFTDEDGRFDFTMIPRYDNFTKTKLLFVDNRCHQVFGLFTGWAKLPTGETIRVQGMPAFCEHAVNNW
ncbi:MAG TPA: DUF2804 domain-containing protein [Clostridia bacterium]|nr:DUF2804 domain-containing protein [Clostridia bacterium]